jgi:hypothetical protein
MPGFSWIADVHSPTEYNYSTFIFDFTNYAINQFLSNFSYPTRLHPTIVMGFY